MLRIDHVVQWVFWAVCCSGCGNVEKMGPLDPDTGSDADADADADGDADGDTTGGPDGDADADTFGECTSLSEAARNSYGPVDVIFAIDNSPSMEDEIEEVRANMNFLASTVYEKGLDMRVILISCLPGDCDNDKFFGICIDPPFGGGAGCPADDTKLPDYLHVSVKMPSSKEFERIIGNYGSWKDMIRPESSRHIVVVTDDESLWTGEQFESALLKLDPSFAGFFFHAIYAYMSKDDACAAGHPCCKFAAPDGEGATYRKLVEKTGGVSGDMCEQDFDPVFEALGLSFIGHARLSCEWQIPPPPSGEELDPHKVNVVVTDKENKKHPIGHVHSKDACQGVEHGWYYDDEADPQIVYACPQTCEWIRGLPQASISLEFGCATEQANPI